MSNIETEYRNGFVKQAQAYGLSERTAVELFNEKHANVVSDLSAWLGEKVQDFSPPAAGSPYIPPEGAAAMLPIGGAALGGLGGAGIGALAGGLNGKKDEKGQTHRIRNAILGGLGGGVLGAGAGGATGALGSAAVMYDPMAYQSAALPSSIGNQFRNATRPLTEGAGQAWDSLKGLFD